MEQMSRIFEISGRNTPVDNLSEIREVQHILAKNQLKATIAEIWSRPFILSFCPGVAIVAEIGKEPGLTPSIGPRLRAR